MTCTRPRSARSSPSHRAPRFIVTPETRLGVPEPGLGASLNRFVVKHGVPKDYDFRFQLSEEEFRQAHQRYLRSSLLTVRNFVLLTTALGIGSLQAQLFGAAEWPLRIFVGLW